MSKLLINENPLILLPSLAVALNSVDAAIVLQQVHYWIADPRAPERDGHRWHYATFDQWHLQFPWMCLRTLKTIVSKLENLNLIISKEFNQSKGNRTKWYTIDYIELSKFETSQITHSAKLAPPSCQSCTTIVQNLHDLYKEEETTKEIIKDIGTKSIDDALDMPALKKESSITKITSAEIDEMFERLWFEYPNKKGKQKAKQTFFKKFLNLTTIDAEKLMVTIFDGLCAHITESVLYEKVRNEKKSWRVFYPSWPHGSTWMSEERWKDSYLTNYDEVLNELSEKNSGYTSRADKLSAVFKGTYQPSM